jgi:predicted nucleic acid-binding protein
VTQEAVVLDCSVVVDALAGPDGPALVRGLTDLTWHAPDYLGIEVASALRGLTLGGHLSAARAAEAVRDFADLGIDMWPLPTVALERVLDLRDRLTAYDAGYVVCAEAFDCPLVTRDVRLGRAIAGQVEVRIV